MTTTATTEQTTGAQLAASDAIRGAIDTITTEVQRQTEQITDTRGPIDAQVQSYDELMARAAETRGRGLLYPYIGSGAGNGALVELADGSVKWDMIGGIGVNFFGHSHPELVRANLEASIEDTTKHGNLQSNFGAYRFAETLLAEARKNSRLNQIFVTTSGAMANESAVKVCYQHRAPAGRVIAFKHCFMGRSVTMANIGDSAAGRQGLPLTTPVDYMPFWNDDGAEAVGGKTKFIDHALWRLDQLVERYPDQHACFIFELIQGEGGFNVPPRDYLVALMQRCKDHGIPVWDDEIQTFGRTERMFAYETFDVGEFVDVFCVGKMTQACATLFTDEMAPKPGLLSGTFTGTTTDFASGTRIIEMLRDGDYYGDEGLIRKHHEAFRAEARKLMDKHPDWFGPAPFGGPNPGGHGGMMRITPFGGDKAKVAAACKACFDEGIVLFWCGHGPYHVRMLPPLGVMKLEDWPRVFECLERGFARVAG